jgi:hypothetical protein
MTVLLQRLRETPHLLLDEQTHLLIMGEFEKEYGG